MSEPWPIFWFDEIDSTNEEAKRRIAGGPFADQWLVARRQTAGRGRLGRRWVSPEGNLFATALFTEPGGLPVAARVPFLAGLAVFDTVDAFAPTYAPQLKWPNDVRVGGRKLSGILVEAGEHDGRVWVAAGIGLNLISDPGNVGQPATTLAALRGDSAIVPETALPALHEAFARRLAEARASFADTLSAWTSHAEGIGQPVRVTVNGQAADGVFESLGPDGALMLRLADGQRVAVRAGDVDLINTVPPNAPRH